MLKNKFLLYPILLIIIIALCRPVEALVDPGDPVFTFGVDSVYGWYYQDLTVGKGNMRAKYIQEIADFRKDIFDGGIGGFIEFYKNRINISYVGTDGFTFRDISYQDLSVTLDANVITLSRGKFSGESGSGINNEIHVRYKQNSIHAEKRFGDFTGYKDVKQNYDSNWYNMALVYYHTMYYKVPGNPLLDGKFWGGLSTGGFKYDSGITWNDTLGQPHESSLYLKTQSPYPGMNIGLDATFGTGYREGMFFNLGVDSVFVFNSKVKSSISGVDRVMFIVLEMYGSVEYRFSSSLRIAISGVRTLNQSMATRADYNGITFIEQNKNIQFKLSLVF